MTSIQSNPILTAAVNAIATEITKAILPFATMSITPIASRAAMADLLCNCGPGPTQGRAGLTVFPDGTYFDPNAKPQPGRYYMAAFVPLPDGTQAQPWQVGNVADLIDRQPALPPRCGCPGWAPLPAVDPITVTSPARDGRAEIDLGDGYTMTLDERSSEIVITDADGDKTRIWGDPHVDVNGKRVGDFYDTTTFELKNGTKITINTEPWKAGGNGAYVASQVVITRGDQGVVVDGISQNDRGDLRITTGHDGRALDFAHDDGFNLSEAGDKGSYGWNSEFTGERVTRSEMKEMTLHENRDMREAMEAQRDLGDAFVSWLFLGDLGGLLSLAGSESFERDAREDLQERPVYRFLESIMGVDR